MSLLIMALDHKKKEVYLAGDHRGTMSKDGKRTFQDDCPKVLKLGPGLYLGISGQAEQIQSLYKDLKAQKYLKPSEVIEFIKNYKIERHWFEGEESGCTFFLAGAYDDFQPFIWHRSTGECETHDLVKGKSFLLVSVPGDETDNASVRSNFSDNLEFYKGNFFNAIVKAALHASKIDERVSPSIDIVTINCSIKKASFHTLKLINDELV